METLFGRYRVGDVIGEGSFGKVYIGYSLKTNCKVAIKVDHYDDETSTLTHEAKILTYLRGPPYIPVIHYYGVLPETNKSHLVMNLMGSSLEDYKNNKGRITERNALIIGIKCLQILKYIHNKSIIHRDIKPENILFNHSTSDNFNTLNIIDFGLAKKYRDSEKKHISIRYDKPLVGTLRYVSAYVQEGIEASRRDDFISLAYMLIYLQVDALPWQGIKKTYKEKEKEILRFKKNTASNILCSGLNECFMHLLVHGKSLQFTGQPDYDRYESKLRRELSNTRY